VARPKSLVVFLKPRWLLWVYSVEKLGFTPRPFFRLPGVDSDNCEQFFAQANSEDSRKTIAIGR
jgi:hypothetical protein